MAVLSVLARELLARLLLDTPLSFVATILCVYGVGTFISFRLQEALTFKRIPEKQRRASVFNFYAVAVFVGAMTAGLAYLLRYLLGFDELFKPYGAATSYACSTLITSVVSFVLSSKFVFRP